MVLHCIALKQTQFALQPSCVYDASDSRCLRFHITSIKHSIINYTEP